MKQSWPDVPLYEVCSSIVDCVNKTAPVVADTTPYRMIRTTNVKAGEVDLETVRYVTEDTYRTWTRRQVPRIGDVILTREAPLGEVGMLRNADGVFLGQRLMSYRANPDKLEAHFLLYALQGEHLQDQIRSAGSGATVEHMRVPDAEKLRIKLPRLPTQRKIAAILSAYDDLIENNTRRVRVLEDMARALYREWFVEYRYPGHEHDEFVEDEQGRRPKGWDFRRLGSIAFETRRAVDPTSLDPETRYVGLEHIPRRKIALDDWGPASGVQSTKLRFDAGDVLFGKIRPYFHKVSVASAAGVCSTDAIVIKALKPEWWALTVMTVSSDEFVDHAVQTSNGTKMPRASWAVLTEYEVGVPPVHLLEKFNELVLSVVEQGANLTQRNANLRRTRDLLLPRLVSGLDIRGAAEDVVAEAEAVA